MEKTDIPFFHSEDQALLDEYAEADRLYFEHKEIYDRRKEALKAVLAVIGQGAHWQDADGIVYRIEPRQQAIVDLTPSEIRRTQRKVGETYVLARKTAEELGYEPFKPVKEQEAKAGG